MRASTLALGERRLRIHAAQLGLKRRELGVGLGERQRRRARVEPGEDLAPGDAVALADQALEQDALGGAADREEVGLHAGVGLVHVEDGGADPLRRPGGHGGQQDQQEQDPPGEDQQSTPARRRGGVGGGLGLGLGRRRRRSLVRGDGRAEPALGAEVECASGFKLPGQREASSGCH